MTPAGEAPSAHEAKRCCAAAYGSDWARLLLGDSYHPGGLALTERLGALLGLGPGMHVLDVAAGTGVSAIHLADRFGCQMTGIDLSEANVAAAQVATARAGVGGLTRFVAGDAERLPFPNDGFDAVICECAFCTFPDKQVAAAEFARVLRPGGRVGMSDLTREGPLPAELDGLLAWIACIADARPLAEYEAYLRHAGFRIDHAEPHHDALGAMVREVRAKLMGVELLVGLKKLDPPGIDLGQAGVIARAAAEAVQAGTLGYALLVGVQEGSGAAPPPAGRPRGSGSPD
ncbi:MAG TPA: methyltransferase domain-containing protein [Chloroflexota bacterium]|nr:methyltransferase domain-containing protein [Chloroflexota bacterium]